MDYNVYSPKLKWERRTFLLGDLARTSCCGLCTCYQDCKSKQIMWFRPLLCSCLTHSREVHFMRQSFTPITVFEESGPRCSASVLFYDSLRESASSVSNSRCRYNLFSLPAKEERKQILINPLYVIFICTMCDTRWLLVTFSDFSLCFDIRRRCWLCIHLQKSDVQASIYAFERGMLLFCFLSSHFFLPPAYALPLFSFIWADDTPPVLTASVSYVASMEQGLFLTGLV